jgi:hypothetical protein
LNSYSGAGFLLFYLELFFDAYPVSICHLYV